MRTPDTGYLYTCDRCGRTQRDISDFAPAQWYSWSPSRGNETTELFHWCSSICLDTWVEANSVITYHASPGSHMVGFHHMRLAQ